MKEFIAAHRQPAAPELCPTETCGCFRFSQLATCWSQYKPACPLSPQQDPLYGYFSAVAGQVTWIPPVLT